VAAPLLHHACGVPEHVLGKSAHWLAFAAPTNEMHASCASWELTVPEATQS
jgi:hypothetical protein